MTMEMEVNRSVDMSNTINTAIANWSTDGRNQLYETQTTKPSPLISFLSLAMNSTSNYSKTIRTNSKRNWVNQLGVSHMQPQAGLSSNEAITRFVM